jgi:tetratricopeptide (TPR) repeat protein
LNIPVPVNVEVSILPDSLTFGGNWIPFTSRFTLPHLMKALPLFCTGVSLLLNPSLRAQAPAPANTGKLELKDDTNADAKVKLEEIKKVDVGDPSAPADGPQLRILPGLEKLSLDQRKVMMAGMGEVSNYLRGVRLQESLEKLNDLEAAVGDNHYIENLRGAVYTKMRNFKAARPHFTKALELAKGMEPESFHPRFNLAELDFVEKKWDDARASFQKLLKDPGKPGNASDPLIRFKIMICDLQQKKAADAEVLMSTFDQYDADSPAYYYGQAVKLFVKNDKDGANDWLESAKRIYPKDINEVFNDSLVEMGWLETLQ